MIYDEKTKQRHEVEKADDYVKLAPNWAWWSRWLLQTGLDDVTTSNRRTILNRPRTGHGGTNSEMNSEMNSES